MGWKEVWFDGRDGLIDGAQCERDSKARKEFDDHDSRCHAEDLLSVD